MVKREESDSGRRFPNLCDEDEEHDFGYILGTTTGFVLRGRDNRVILGSDRQKQLPSGGSKSPTTKTFRLLELPIVYTRTGSAADSNKLIEELKRFAAGNVNITMMPDHLYNWGIDELGQGHGGQLLIGGYHSGFTIPHLYYVSKDGVLELTADHGVKEIKDRFQTGSGKGAAFCILNNYYEPDKNEIAGEDLMERCLLNAINNDEHTGIGVDIMVVKPTGVTKTRKVLDVYGRLTHIFVRVPA